MNTHLDVVLTKLWAHTQPFPALQTILNFSTGATLGAIIDIISQQASPSLYHPTLNLPGGLWAMFWCWTQSSTKLSVRPVHTPDDNKQNNRQHTSYSHSPIHLGNNTTTPMHQESHIALADSIAKLSYGIWILQFSLPLFCICKVSI